MKLRKLFLAGLLTMSCVASLVGCGNEQKEEETTANETVTEAEPETESEYTLNLESNSVTFSRVTVHDPSIVKDGDTYYIFGSHIDGGGYAKSTDLKVWKSFDLNIKTEYNKIFEEPHDKWQASSGSSIRGNLWAPDVIYNETMGKWCMYMSLNGNNWQSVICLLTADNIEGPYEYVGNVIYSGFYDKGNSGESVLNEERVAYSDIYDVLEEGTNLSRYNTSSGFLVNAIDPNVMYDENGDLWMTYGSWSSGIYQIKLDVNTGLRDYSYTYEPVDARSIADAYYGYKIAGGYYVSGEAPYIIKSGDYYFLFVTYGGLSAAEGYNMRLFRSESINGPFVDQKGVSAVYTGFSKNYGLSRGLKILGNNDMAGFFDISIQVAQGHNSAMVDDDGNIYLVYHTRFVPKADTTHANQSEGHQVRVRQMYMNEENWLVPSPFEYTGEKIADTYTTEQVAGTYDFIINKQENWFHYSCFKNNDIHNHDKSLCATSEKLGIATAETISLNADGTISGDYTGKWSLSGNKITIDLGDKGKFFGICIEMPDETQSHFTRMSFSVAGENLTAIGVRK